MLATIRPVFIQGLILIALLLVFDLAAFDQVVIWGHKLHTHTHSYIHNAFYRAFTHLGYETYWFDNLDELSDFDFSATLFITEGQVDHKIPLRNDCQYILHNCNPSKYMAIDKNNMLTLQVYTDDVLNYPEFIRVAPCIYCDFIGRQITMPWAADLLPHEIEANKKNLASTVNFKQLYWIGTIGKGFFGNIDEITPFKIACEENGISFIHTPPGSLDVLESMQAIQNSYLAPAIVGTWQKEIGYIPCRIFKNISYGAMGLTNSARVYELFGDRIVYNPNTYQLFYDAAERLQTLSLDELQSLMDFVKEKHTYINRIEMLLTFFKKNDDE